MECDIYVEYSWDFEAWLNTFALEDALEWNVAEKVLMSMLI